MESHASEASPDGSRLSLGSFCLADGQIGQVAEAGESSVGVRFFDGPHDGDTRVEEFAAVDVQSVVLPQQTRVWVPRGSAWQVGRVAATPDRNASFYLIALPDKEGAQFEPGEFFTMSSGRPGDPLRILEAKVAETVFFFERRARFVQEMLRQASAAETGWHHFIECPSPSSPGLCGPPCALRPYTPISPGR